MDEGFKHGAGRAGIRGISLHSSPLRVTGFARFSLAGGLREALSIGRTDRERVAGGRNAAPEDSLRISRRLVSAERMSFCRSNLSGRCFGRKKRTPERLEEDDPRSLPNLSANPRKCREKEAKKGRKVRVRLPYVRADGGEALRSDPRGANGGNALKFEAFQEQNFVDLS
ncbi:hypothetical protein HMPREF9440_01117 [Sutterella parvirubra YIT 11816]|uniref:Uncharacterized protein n=1 Tax=Sutterella parvirubra YIT 11816 TaxID=762967 RepID=H3KEF2_9BURK|nr:hypothetical protein HMPREF9440_01117 [Sutterella parvirubra YIT 11816]